MLREVVLVKSTPSSAGRSGKEGSSVRFRCCVTTMCAAPPLTAAASCRGVETDAAFGVEPLLRWHRTLGRQAAAAHSNTRSCMCVDCCIGHNVQLDI